jgi:hypothetical protein
MNESSTSAPAQFRGFTKPNYTQVPNELFDELLPLLSESELKVLLYVMRRTFGFQKSADAISINQMIDGITTRDGTVVDRGTGLSRSSVRRGVTGLVDKGVLVVSQVLSDEGDYATNVYRLRFQDGDDAGADGGSANLDPPPAQIRTTGSLNLDPPVVRNSNPQKKALQKTTHKRENQPTLAVDFDVVERFAADLSRELHDDRPPAERAEVLAELWRQASCDRSQFGAAISQARARARKQSAWVLETGPGGVKNLMPTFLRELGRALAK